METILFHNGENVVKVAILHPKWGRLYFEPTGWFLIRPSFGCRREELPAEFLEELPSLQKEAVERKFRVF